MPPILRAPARAVTSDIGIPANVRPDGCGTARRVGTLAKFTPPLGCRVRAALEEFDVVAVGPVNAPYLVTEELRVLSKCGAIAPQFTATNGIAIRGLSP